MICVFTIGNIYLENIKEIVSRYDPYTNEYMKALINGGAAALLSLAEEKGISIDYSKYYSVCDICREITRQLNLEKQTKGVLHG
jgi:hypothetical protein